MEARRTIAPVAKGVVLTPAPTARLRLQGPRPVNYNQVRCHVEMTEEILATIRALTSARIDSRLCDTIFDDKDCSLSKRPRQRQSSYKT